MDQINPWRTKASYCYWVTIVCFAGLLALMMAAQLLHEFSIKKLIVQWFPLLIFVPGLYRRTHHRTFTWLCFVVLIYFTAYVVEVGSPLRHWTDYIGLGLTVVMFISAMFASRYTQRWQHQLHQNAQPESNETNSDGTQ